MKNIAEKVAFTAISLVLAIAALALADHGNVQRQSFKAFYCAGVALNERSNPYLVEPLRGCERTVADSPKTDAHVEPAPLPGYVLAGFSVLAKLPPKLAAQIFSLTLVLAAILSAQCLSTCLPVARAAILLALAPLTLLNVAYGEIPPLALLALCAGAWLLASRRWIAAGVAVTLALIEPNVGLPAVIAVFAFAPRSRVAIAISAGALALLSFAAVGVTRNLEYFTSVLPLMSRAELPAADQYSFAHLLYSAGLSAPAALLAGKLWFAVVLCAGVLVAGAFATRHRRFELLALLPPAIVLLFGIYLHDIQMLLAIPAALLIAYRARGTTLGTIAAVSLALLIAVWTQRAARTSLVFDFLGVAAGLYAILAGPTARRALQAAGGALVVATCIVALQRFEPPLASTQIVTHGFAAAPGDPAASAWERYLASTPALIGQAYVLKIPTWLGLLGLTFCAVALAAKPVRSESHEPLPGSEPYSVSSQRYD